MKQSRDYQVDADRAIFDGLAKGINKQLLVMATGLGKTYVMAQVIKKFQKALFVTHTEELIQQSAEAISSELYNGNAPLIPYGIIKQERCEINHPLTVASVQTLWRRLDRIPKDHFDIVLCDESHLSAASTWSRALTHFTPKLLIGATATPHRLDGLSLANLFDEIIFDRDIQFGIENGYLVELEGIRVKTGIDLDKVRTTGGELNQGDLEKLLDTPERNKLIVESWLKYSKDEPTLCFCVDMEHAMNVCNAFKEAGVKAEFVTSDKDKCPDREARIKRFKSGETTVMVNVMILTAGFDYPAVSTIITARPTKSLTVFLQQIGRATRPLAGFDLQTKEERIAAILASNKPKAKILDIVDGTTRHQLINTWTLDKDKPVKDRLFITKQKKLEFEEKQRREAKIYHERKVDEIVKLLALPKPPKVKATPNTFRDATDAQKNWLREEGFDVDNKIYTVRDCWEMINGLLATEKQCWRLKKEGYNAIYGVTTRGEAKEAFDEIEQRNIINPIINRIPISGIV